MKQARLCTMSSNRCSLAQLTEYKRKVVADVLEAIIGAFAMAGGAAEVSDFLRRILLLPDETRQPTLRPRPPYQPPATGMASCVARLCPRQVSWVFASESIRSRGSMAVGAPDDLLT